jgi:hypothetical protein
MKRKAFWYGFILLVIVQLLSPWMVNVSPSQITLEKNIARAATERTKIAQPFAFIVVTGINDKQNISVSLFTDRNYKINYIDKIEFIRDEFTYIEKGCPAKDLTLVSKPDLSQPIKNSFAHVDNPSTNNRGYLKQDFIFPIPNTFTAECIDNSAGFDAYGHYKFTYEVEDVNGKKSIRSEDTTTGESVEDLADTIGGVLKHIKDELIYIKAQTDTGNNFNVEWGVISEKKWDPVMLSSQNLVGNLKVQGDSSQTITNLSTDLSKQVQNNIKIKFLQLNKELDLYAVNRTEPFDSKKILPNSKGQYQLTASILFRDLTTTFEPKTTTGVHSSWAALSTNTKQSSKNAFTVGDYVMENYEAKNWTPGIKDGKIVLDIDISMVISAKNSEKFEPWEDIDKDGKASNKDLPGDDWENFTLDFAKPDIDTRSAKDGHGFYLLYSDSEKNDDPTIGGKDVYEVNLNEYIFGTKIPYNPIISEGKTGMTFGIEPIPVETEKNIFF